MGYVSRRRFMQGAGVAGLALVAGCGRLPWQAQAQRSVRPYRIGYLDHGAASPGVDPNEGEAQFRRGLGELGYVEGHDVTIVARYTGASTEQLATAAADLAQQPVDIFVTTPVSATRAAREVTSTIPIVHIAGGTDLLESGLVASLARPGGNVTGMSNVGEELAGKLVQLLKEVAPGISRVAMLTGRESASRRAEPEAAARALGVELEYWWVDGPAELDTAIDRIAMGHADALVVRTTPFTISRMQRIVDVAVENRVPSIGTVHPAYMRAGGLMAYGPSQAGNYHRAATFVDKILKGASPAELPVERPQRFNFIINLQTAAVLGITIPHDLLAQASEVIR